MSAKKRFYKSVTTAGEGDGVAIRLDGRAVKTPGESAVRLPTSALAAAVGVFHIEFELSGNRAVEAAPGVEPIDA